MLFPCKYPEFFARAFGARIEYTQNLFKITKICEIFHFLPSTRENRRFFWFDMHKMPLFSYSNRIFAKNFRFQLWFAKDKIFFGFLYPSLETLLVTPMRLLAKCAKICARACGARNNYPYNIIDSRVLKNYKSFRLAANTYIFIVNLLIP